MWLISEQTKQAMERAVQSGIAPTAEQQADYEASYYSAEQDTPRPLTIAGDKAEIEVKGVLTKEPSFLAFLFGGGNTTYKDIISSLRVARSDPNVKEAVLKVNSPGGAVDGLFDALAELEEFDKPLKATVDGMAASAAYALVSQADTITATNRASSVGSIGIVVTAFVDDQTVDITSTNAPKKRPDPTTKEGKAAIVEELDALHELFVESIASGRGTNTKKVNAEFGQGAMLLADEALKRGMIDEIASRPLHVVKSLQNTNAAISGGKQPETRKMDLATLKAQHPDVYAAAVQDGVAKERDRVNGHLTLGQASGDMKTAMAAIEDGSEMTASLSAKYMAASMNRNDIKNRQEDDQSASALDGAAAPEESDGEAQVLSIVESRLGIQGEAN